MLKNKCMTHKKLLILSLLIGLIISCGIFDSSDSTDKDDKASASSSQAILASPTPQTISTPTLETSSVDDILSNLVQYDHPSGAYSIMVPDGIVSDEGEFSAYFRITDNADLVVAFEVPGMEYSDAELENYSASWLDSTLLETDFAQSYDITDAESTSEAYTTQYNFIHETGDEGKEG